MVAIDLETVMAALKYSRRLPVRSRTEAIEREEYAAAPTPSTTVRRAFAAMVPAPVVTVGDDDDDLPPFARPGVHSPVPNDGPVRIYTRKS